MQREAELRATAASSGYPDRLLDLIRRAGAPRAGEPLPFANARAAGLDLLAREGWPRAKVEAWRYTSLAGLADFDLDAAPAPALPTIAMPAIDDARVAHLAGAARVVIINGQVRPDLSDWDAASAQAELSILGEAGMGDAGMGMNAGQPLAPWAAERFGRVMNLERMPLAAANAAAWRHGLAIRARDAGRADTRPLHLVFVTAPDGDDAMASPRILIALDQGAALNVVESHVGRAGAADGPSTPGATFTNGVCEIDVGRDASLRHYRLVDESARAHHVWASAARVAERGFYEGFALTLDGGVVRNETRVRFTGADAEARVNGAYAVAGTCHVDNTTFMDHAVARARSTQVFKGVVGGSARAVYQGKVLVRADAQKTDAQQLHKAILLSEDAAVDAKPELEIYADDVKCGHGAAIGRLDEDLLFYLLARGIERARARDLLIEAFLAEALDSISDDACRSAFAAALQGRRAALAGDVR